MTDDPQDQSGGSERLDSDERKFLHDLSNPLAVVYGNIQLLLAKMDRDPALPPDFILEKLKKTATYLDKVTILLDQRREWLRAKEE
ncbi:MAG: hypothetical protein KA436_05055 [Oligoflexales bacterium]|nr:hypothetical protein [Oligoflexales bacterium]